MVDGLALGALGVAHRDFRPRAALERVGPLDVDIALQGEVACPAENIRASA